MPIPSDVVPVFVIDWCSLRRQGLARIWISCDAPSGVMNQDETKHCRQGGSRLISLARPLGCYGQVQYTPPSTIPGFRIIRPVFSFSSPKGAIEAARRYGEAVERGQARVEEAEAERLRMQASAAKLLARVDELTRKAEEEAMKVPPSSSPRGV